MNILFGLMIAPVFTIIGQKRISEEQTLPSKRTKHDNNSEIFLFKHFELSELENSFNNFSDLHTEIDFGEDFNSLLCNFIEEELTKHKDVQLSYLENNSHIDYDNIQTKFINEEQKTHENDLKKVDDTSKNLIFNPNSNLYNSLNETNDHLIKIGETNKGLNCKEHILFEEANSQNKECYENIMENLLNQFKLPNVVSFEEDFCNEYLKNKAISINAKLQDDSVNSIIDLTESISEEESETNEKKNYNASFLEIKNNLEFLSLENIFLEKFIDTNESDKTNEILLLAMFISLNVFV